MYIYFISSIIIKIFFVSITLTCTGVVSAASVLFLQPMATGCHPSVTGTVMEAVS